MAHQLQLEKEKYRQWVKAGLGLGYLKEGLVPFCNDIADQQHKDILQNIRSTKSLTSTVTCGGCRVETLKPDHKPVGNAKNKVCPLGQVKCNCCFKGKIACPNNICGAIYDFIVQHHASSPPAPNWKNSDAQQWTVDPWTICKCFINTPGYEDKNTAVDTDCTGLLHVIINNQYFHSHIGCNVTATHNRFSKVRQYRNAIFHSSSMELEETEANDYIYDMIAVLQDGKELLCRQDAQQAVLKLQELVKKDFVITSEIKDEMSENVAAEEEHEELKEMNYKKTKFDEMSWEGQELTEFSNILYERQHQQGKLDSEEELRHGKDKLPEEIRNMDDRSIQIYERALQEGKVPVRNIRVMVVGHFGVGKSTLTKRLLGMPVDIKIRKPTEGIDVHTDRCKLLKDGTWMLPKSGKERFNVLGQLAKVLLDVPKDDATDDDGAQMMNTKGTETDFARSLAVDPSFHVSVQQEKNEEPFCSPVHTELTHQESLPDSTKKKGETTKAKEKRDDELKKLVADVLQYEEKGDGNLSIWDFAGQDMFYSTHQVFLCKRAVYLLITDLSKNLNENVEDPWSGEERTKRKVSEYIDFWLNSIHHHCGYSKENGPPIVLIGTFADKLPERMTRGDAKETLNRHLVNEVAKSHLTEETFLIDNSIEDENIARLRKHIFDAAKGQKEYWEKEIPAKWMILESIIMGLKDSKIKFISKEKLQELNLALPVPLEDEELEVYLHFHHEAGNILYFSQRSLNGYVIIDPQWLIDAFKSMTMAGEKCSNKRKTNVAAMWRDFKNSAQLKQELIDEIWTEDDNINHFKSNKDLLLEFLEILGLIVKPHHEESNEIQAKNYFLVPMKLQNRPPKEITSSADRKDCKYSSKLCFTTCKKPEERFLPDVLFNKFLAACIKKWELVYKKSIPMVFYKGAIFNLKEDNHDLNIVHYDHVIQIWVTRYSSDGKLPSSALCSELKHEVIEMFESVIRNKNNIEMFVKCCKANVFSNQCMFPLVEDQDWENRCDCGDESHCVTYRDLMQCWLEGCLARDQKESFKFDGRLIQLTEIQTESLRRSLDKNAIGSGTFGQVYRSNDSKIFGIPVAVKMITKTDCVRAQKHARMEMMANRLMNPFILPLIAFVKKSIGETWLITPYLENGDLEKAIKEGKARKDKMKINMQRTRVRIALHIALAIQYIHTEIPNVRCSILHKDISSSNVVLDKNLNARLIDFGLAREKDDTSKTYSEKPGYTHPKKGDPHIKESLDYYSFGIIIRELLTSLGPAEENKKYLQEMDKNEIKGELDKQVWVDEKITEKLNNLSKMCLEKYTWTTEEFERNVIKTLQDMRRDESDLYEWAEKTCHHCIINTIATNSSLNHNHTANCLQKIEVCMACEKNSILNPVKCYCGAKLESVIGSKWGALLVAGDDEKPKKAEAMKREILELERMITSKAPRIIGISKCNVKTVVPCDKSAETKKKIKSTWTEIEEHISYFAKAEDIDTLLIYFSCHGENGKVKESSERNMFQLGTSPEIISLDAFQEQLETLNKIDKLIIFLDHCFPPMVEFKDRERDFIQINACSEGEKANLEDEGSLFTKYVIQGLKARSEKRECSKNCQHCSSYWERRKEYISIGSLFNYVNDHLKHKAPLPKWHVKTTETDIAFFTEDVVHIEFTSKCSQTPIRLPLEYLKNIDEVKLMLLKEFKVNTETHVVKIEKDIFRNDQEADDECKTLEQVMEAWVNRFPLHVSFLEKRDA